MNSREELINKVVEKEWDMFQNVSNVGGRASCQDARTQGKTQRNSWRPGGRLNMPNFHQSSSTLSTNLACVHFVCKVQT